MRTLLFIVSLFAGVVVATAQPVRVVAFYNLENLMDAENDPLTQDDDMLPNADREWNAERYAHKLKSISRVVADMALKYDYPVLLGVAEVENGSVMQALASQISAEGANYSFIHYDSPDERGIDVALLYRPEYFAVERSRSIKADVEMPTRDHLLVWGRLCGEPVLVTVVHFPSRIGGKEFTSARRERCASQIREIVDSVRHAEPDRRVIIMGDMNDTPRDCSVRSSLGAGWRKDGELYNPFYRANGRGTMVYQDRWWMYDQIILSSDFLAANRLSLAQLRGYYGFIFKQPYLLDARGYPLPTYLSTQYQGGVSDHLPIYVLLRENGESVVSE